MRVIAGEHGGRRLKAVPGKETRPTTDKIKESLFNIIGPYFDESTRVLDFYAGSGALGIEALSRGAGTLYACERHRPAIQTIQENIETIGLADQMTILTGSNQKALKKLRQEDDTLQFDLVFLDPPYKDQQIKTVIEQFIVDHWLSPTCMVVCELEKKDSLPDTIQDLVKVKEVTYGITKLVIYQWNEDEK